MTTRRVQQPNPFGAGLANLDNATTDRCVQMLMNRIEVIIEGGACGALPKMERDGCDVKAGQWMRAIMETPSPPTGSFVYPPVTEEVKELVHLVRHIVEDDAKAWQLMCNMLANLWEESTRCFVPIADDDSDPAGVPYSPTSPSYDPTSPPYRDLGD